MSERYSASNSERAASGSACRCASKAASSSVWLNVRVPPRNRQHVGTVGAVILLVLRVHQSNAAVGRRDREQHAAGGQQARQQRAIDLDVGRGSAVIPPEADLVENDGAHRSPSESSGKNWHARQIDDAALELDFGAGDRSRSHRAARERRQEPERITMDHGGLLATGSNCEHGLQPRRGSTDADEGCEIHGEAAAMLRFSTSPAMRSSDSFAHPPGRRLAVTATLRKVSSSASDSGNPNAALSTTNQVDQVSIGPSAAPNKFGSRNAASIAIDDVLLMSRPRAAHMRRNSSSASPSSNAPPMSAPAQAPTESRDAPPQAMPAIR